MTKVIVAMVVFNEEEYIERTIDNLIKKIHDIDVIEILDGAWTNGGNSIHSTDNTKMMVEKLQKKYQSSNTDIVFRESERMFTNESDKRNTQLQTIDENYGYESYWVFVLDADELLQFTTGKYDMWLKDSLGDMPFIGCLTAYAHGGDKPMYGPRLFPGGKGIHYHTNRSMIVHDGDHETEINYNLDNQHSFVNGATSKSFHLSDFFIINLWPTRKLERMKWKADYCKYQEEIEIIQNKPCEYQKVIKGI